MSTIRTREKNLGMLGCYANQAEQVAESEVHLCLDFLLNTLVDLFLGSGVAGAFSDKRLEFDFEVLTVGAA